MKPCFFIPLTAYCYRACAACTWGRAGGQVGGRPREMDFLLVRINVGGALRARVSGIQTAHHEIHCEYISYTVYTFSLSFSSSLPLFSSFPLFLFIQT